jgi:hypothetical protein
MTGLVVLVGAVALVDVMHSVAEEQQPTERQRIEATRDALQQWVDTRKVIAAELRDLELGKQTLNDRIDLVDRETESLQGRIVEAEKSVTEADRKRAELAEENDRLKEASSSLTETIVKLEARIRKLLAMLPPDAVPSVNQLALRLPKVDAKPDEIKMSLSERYLTVIGIANAINKFNRAITVTSEMRNLPDGSNASVATVYVGLGRAYYVSGNGQIAGIGTLIDGQWQWVPMNESAPQIAKIIAILKNEEVASFVSVPFELK